MARVFAFALALLVVSGSGAAIEAGKNRPVSKVITLLKDMVGQLQKEGEEDQEVYQAFGCWCETGLKGKTQAITDAEQKIASLSQSILSLGKNGARLNAEIANLNKEIAANEEALASATSMRKKEMAEFNADESSMLSSISAMKGAVKTLSTHNAGVFLQQSSSVREKQLLEVVAAVQAELRRHPRSVSNADRIVMESFFQAPEHFVGTGKPRVALLQQGHNPAHATASGEIFGVLNGMKESFEVNLAASQKEESTNQADYESLKLAKTTEIAAGNSAANAKTEELADADSRKAESEQDQKDTRRTLEADQAFLANLKEQCAIIDEEFEERTKTRQMEITAVSKALEFLSGDDAADLFARTFSLADTSPARPTHANPMALDQQGPPQRALDKALAELEGPDTDSLQAWVHGGGGRQLQASFLQMEASSRRATVSGILAAAARRARDPRLSALATRVQSPQDAFVKVKASIQDMIDKLVAEKEEEISKKDYCIDSIQKNEKETDGKNRVKADSKAAIEELADHIQVVKKDIVALKAEIATLQISLKKAGEDREKEHKEFQMTVADQRATSKLLMGALDVLKGFYEKDSLVQVRDHEVSSVVQPAGPPPPPGFKKNTNKSGGVMSMIKQIIEDADAMVEQALKGEEDSQIAYESFVKETNDSITSCQRSINNKSQDLAQSESDLAQMKVELETVETELSELASASEDLHSECDYTLKNFDIRQAARDDEIMALKEAISIFSGASFDALLQVGR